MKRLHRTVELPYGIVIDVDVDGRSAGLKGSLLKGQFIDPEDPPAAVARGELAADVVECLLVALVAAGVNLETSAAREAISGAVEAVANHLP